MTVKHKLSKTVPLGKLDADKLGCDQRIRIMSGSLARGGVTSPAVNPVKPLTVGLADVNFNAVELKLITKKKSTMSLKLFTLTSKQT